MERLFLPAVKQPPHTALKVSGIARQETSWEAENKRVMKLQHISQPHKPFCLSKCTTSIWFNFMRPNQHFDALTDNEREIALRGD